MTPAKLPLTPFTEGDTWDGIPSITVTVGPTGGPFVPPTSALSTVTLRFKKAGAVPSAVVELSSAEGEITISSSVNWQVAVAAQIIPELTAGKWTWRMRFTNAAGKKITYLADEFTVFETV